jgi:hypothetical protein
MPSAGAKQQPEMGRKSQINQRRSSLGNTRAVRNKASLPAVAGKADRRGQNQEAVPRRRVMTSAMTAKKYRGQRNKQYLAGAGVGGAVGGVTGALIGLGIPEYEAKRYEGRIKKGGILLSVHCDTSDEVKRAKEIMKNIGAEDVSSTGESSSDYPAGEPQVRRTSSGGTS